MMVKVASVEGFYHDSKDIEFTLELLDRTDNPKCMLMVHTEKFTLPEWQAFNRAVEAAFALVTEKA